MNASRACREFILNANVVKQADVLPRPRSVGAVQRRYQTLSALRQFNKRQVERTDLNQHTHRSKAGKSQNAADLACVSVEHESILPL